MLLKIVYMLTCRVPSSAALGFRCDRAKDAELLVLRHENAVLRIGTDPAAQALDRDLPGDASDAPGLAYNGEQLGEFDKPHVDEFRSRLTERDHLTVRPHATTLGGQPFLDTDYQQFLLSVDPYDPSEHDEFRRLIEEGRLRLEIVYESIYGGEGFTVVYPRRGLISSPPAGDRS